MPDLAALPEWPLEAMESMSQGRYICTACGCDFHNTCVNLRCPVGYHHLKSTGAPDFDRVDFADPLSAPADWIAATSAVRWGRWRWPVDVFKDIQAWGDSNCCRFILVSEANETTGAAVYDTWLYIAPKPNRRATGLDDLSRQNRDKHMSEFASWLSGYLAGRGLGFPGERLP